MRYKMAQQLGYKSPRSLCKLNVRRAWETALPLRAWARRGNPEDYSPAIQGRIRAEPRLYSPGDSSPSEELAVLRSFSMPRQLPSLSTPPLQIKQIPIQVSVAFTSFAHLPMETKSSHSYGMTENLRSFSEKPNWGTCRKDTVSSARTLCLS